MKKFIIKSIYFFVLTMFFYFILSKVSSNQIGLKNDYMAAIIDKHKIANSIKQPKLILAGASSLAFGIDSELIEKEIKKPVVNLGIHGGLGLEFILNELKDVVKKGDIIFLSPEYLLSIKGDYKLKKLTSSYYEKANNYFTNNIVEDLKIHIDKTRDNLKSLNFNDSKIDQVDVLKAKKSFDVKSIYSRHAFNSHGDVISHLEAEKPKELNDRKKMDYEYWEGIELLNQFNEFANANGIKVYYLFPNYPRTEFKKNREIIQKLEYDLRTNLKIKILNNPNDFVYDDSLFYDTVYHLDKKGRNLRTEKLIEFIKKYVK
jgi:hypothetical protein